LAEAHQRVGAVFGMDDVIADALERAFQGGSPPRGRTARSRPRVLAHQEQGAHTDGSDANDVPRCNEGETRAKPRHVARRGPGEVSNFGGRMTTPVRTSAPAVGAVTDAGGGSAAFSCCLGAGRRGHSPGKPSRPYRAPAPGASRAPSWLKSLCTPCGRPSGGPPRG
jgi:hypothetical protein